MKITLFLKKIKCFPLYIAANSINHQLLMQQVLIKLSLQWRDEDIPIIHVLSHITYGHLWNELIYCCKRHLGLPTQTACVSSRNQIKSLHIDIDIESIPNNTWC